MIFQKNFFYQTLPAVIAGLAITAIAVFAWTEPTTAPPGGNVAAPLNTSNVGQSKAGGLILNTGGAGNGLIVQYGNVGIGTTNPGDNKLKISSPAGTIGLEIEAALGNNAILELNRPTTGNWGVYKIQTAGVGTDGWSFGAIAGTNRFGFMADDDSLKERLTILNNGNVGIGTTGPGAKLDIQVSTGTDALKINTFTMVPISATELGVYDSNGNQVLIFDQGT